MWPCFSYSLNVPLDIYSDEKHVYYYLNQDLKFIWYKMLLHGFNIHWIFQESNYLYKQKIVLCFVHNLSKNCLPFKIIIWPKAVNITVFKSSTQHPTFIEAVFIVVQYVDGKCLLYSSTWTYTYTNIYSIKIISHLPFIVHLRIYTHSFIKIILSTSFITALER